MSKKKVVNWLKDLSLTEKATLCSGQDLWSTNPIERIGIPSVKMFDGPHGLRKVDPQVSLGKSLAATCFPTACSLAATWNVDLLTEVGEAIGKECQANDAQILLGPGINIKRSPLGGRNFEYYSEDPLLSGKMGAAFVRGLQSMGVAACIKHFTANNQEFERMMNDSIVDSKTLHEIYLKSFEIVVKEANPWAVMCAYNAVNGTWASEHKRLLSDLLREQFGFEGFVVSDWGAVYHPDKAVNAGLHLEMPANPLSPAKIVEAVQNGDLSEEQLNKVVGEFLSIVLKVHNLKKPSTKVSLEDHHNLAKKVAEESIVLLKNEGNLLPILPKEKKQKIAIIGQFAKVPRIQGSGSSRVNPFKVESAWEHLLQHNSDTIEWRFSEGYTTNHSLDTNLLAEAVATAQLSNKAVLFVGLPDDLEMEGKDRKHLSLPEGDLALIQAVSAVQKNTIVVLTNGSPVVVQGWINGVGALVWSGLLGQAGGGAIVEVLLGKINPSGKTAESWPQYLEQNPSYLSFSGKNRKVYYQEGMFVGYRYYTSQKIVPQFPFGYGLSYTRFEYSNLMVNQSIFYENDQLSVSLSVKNIGSTAGQEIVQFYVKPLDADNLRPVTDLRGFDKIHLAEGEQKTISISLDKEAFSVYNETTQQWCLVPGKYAVVAAKSSIDEQLSVVVEVKSVEVDKTVFDKYSTVGELWVHPKGRMYAEEMSHLFGISLEKKEGATDMFEILRSMPIAKRVNFSEGAYTDEMLIAFLDDINA